MSDYGAFVEWVRQHQEEFDLKPWQMEWIEALWGEHAFLTTSDGSGTLTNGRSRDRSEGGYVG